MNINNSSIYNEPLGSKYSREAHLKRSSFYVSSFKQLNSMQTRQVGLIMGACVADAALRGLEELTEGEIKAMIEKNDAYETEVLREAMKERAAKAAQEGQPSISSDVAPSYASYNPVTRPDGFSLLDPCVFSAGSVRKGLNRRGKSNKSVVKHHDANTAGLEPNEVLSTNEGPTMSPIFRDELLVTRASHSYSYLFFKEYLRTVATHRHAVGLTKVEQSWSSIERLFPVDHSIWHGSAPHVVASLAAVPVNYPWAADDNLRAYSTPFAEFLSVKDLVKEEGAAQQVLTSSGSVPSATHQELLFDPHVIPQALSALSLPLRCMAHNPDPVRNNALQAMPFSEGIFPVGHRGLVPGATLIGEGETSDGTTSEGQDASITTSLSAAVLHHQQLMRTAMHIVDKARTYTEGVLMASRAATHAYPMAAACSSVKGSMAIRPLGAFAVGPLGVIVGAALGAKFAVKSIPVEWMSATADHEVVGTHAIQMAEWSWNTPSRLRK